MSNPFYITTSIAYVNAAPHLGFAMELIESDAIARWQRQQGREVRFQTGTDEHGIKIAQTAEKIGKTPQEVCDENAQKFQDLTQKLNISCDRFIRTTDRQDHFPGVQALWNVLMEKGDIQKKSYQAKYCSGCEAFLNEKDLDENGNCPHHLRPPEEVEEENYFFMLSKYSQQIVDLIESDTLEIVPAFRKNEILAMAKEGFQDISFSRPTAKVSWGIPVPNDDTQTMYVWCDALTNYISALGYGSSDTALFDKFWNLSGEKMHVIGKDILRFHAGIWIGMLLSAEITLPNKIFVHGFLASEGQKMSKSLGNVVDPFEKVDFYGVDALRYFLLREVPIGRDADFSVQRFEEIYQAHLANGLGNLTSRVHKLCSKIALFTPSDSGDFVSFFTNQKEAVQKAMKKYELHTAMEEVMKGVDFLDKQMDTLKPWILMKENPEKAKEVLSDFLFGLQEVSMMIEPFLPTTAQKLSDAFGKFEGSFGELQMLFPRVEKLYEAHEMREEK